MYDVLQALAKMLNMTTDEVSSLLSTFKGNAPQIYETLLKEKMFYDVFGFFEKNFICNAYSFFDNLNCFNLFLLFL